MTLTAFFEEIPAAQGGGYVASVIEELPGAISEGATLEEARENLRDAIEVLFQANRQIPAVPQPDASSKRIEGRHDRPAVAAASSSVSCCRCTKSKLILSRLKLVLKC